MRHNILTRAYGANNRWNIPEPYIRSPEQVDREILDVLWVGFCD